MRGELGFGVVGGAGFSVCPKGADYQWGKDPLEYLMVRFDSWRAVRSGNWLGWNLVTKSTKGGRATWQAVTRVKLEQASKDPMWCRPGAEAGKAESIRKNPARERVKPTTSSTDRTTGVVSTACQEGNHASVGEARGGRGSRDPRRCRKGQRTIWASERARGTVRSRVTPVEGRALAYGVLEKEERSGDWR